MFHTRIQLSTQYQINDLKSGTTRFNVNVLDCNLNT